MKILRRLLQQKTGTCLKFGIVFQTLFSAVVFGDENPQNTQKSLSDVLPIDKSLVSGGREGHGGNPLQARRACEKMPRKSALFSKIFREVS